MSLFGGVVGSLLSPDPLAGALVGNALTKKKGAAGDPGAGGYDPAIIQAWQSSDPQFQGSYQKAVAGGWHGPGGFQQWFDQWLASSGDAPRMYADFAKQYQASQPVPIEQQILNAALPSIEAQATDPSYGELAKSLQDQSQKNFGTLADVFKGAIPDASGVSPLLTQENTAAQTAADEQRSALSDEMQKLYAAQDPTSKVNLDAAESLATAANLAGQRQKQDILAKFAGQGFVGGSTMEDNALAQALIGAQQNAAQAVGNAKVQNAQANTNIGDYGANTGYGLASALAQQRQSNLMNQHQQAVSAATGLAGIPATEAATIPGIANVANAGLLNAQNALNWWSTSGSPSTPGYVPVTASNAGNDIANLGSGLLSGALSVGNANNWWQTPKTAPQGVTSGQINSGVAATATPAALNSGINGASAVGAFA